MLVVKPYGRERAVMYARRYAFGQNPVFGNFRGIGGNCTNFVSQCVYAGSCRMNYTPVVGWYYISLNERTASWTGVEFFYNFMTTNMGVGPFGRIAGDDELEVGDVIQLGRNGEGFYHTLLVVAFEGDEPLVAAQTDDALERPLSTYTYDFSRNIKILGVRVPAPDSDDCFYDVYEGRGISPFAPSGESAAPQNPAPDEGIAPEPENQ